MTQTIMIVTLGVLDYIITHLRYQEHSGTMLYRFEKSIELPIDIVYEGKHYHWIDEIGINKVTNNLEYICSSRNSELVQGIPFNIISTEILQKVYNHMLHETQK